MHQQAIGLDPERGVVRAPTAGLVALVEYHPATIDEGADVGIRRGGGEAARVGDPQAGQTSNLDSITAAVLGGISLFGGRGNIIGTLIGALIVGVFRNGLQLIGIPSIYQVLITGILVILAVSVDQLSHKGQA